VSSLLGEISRSDSVRRRLALANARYETVVVVAIAVLVAVRLAVAGATPPSPDELLYWRYSRFLAPGYIDHGAINPLFIRLGTSLFGDTSFGVRFFAVLTALPASWAVWRASALLLGSERAGATAALFLNLTVALSVGSILATSDSMVVLTSAFLLWAIAKLLTAQRGIWWLAVGVAVGVGMNAKYTTAFLALGVALWTLATPVMRRWLLTPWPYAAALLALALFSPVLWWNSQHQWASLAYQGGRAVIRAWAPGHLPELIASQIGLATPPIFLLAVLGLALGRRSAQPGVWALLVSLTTPILVYLSWHALHERVQGNWPECVYPAVACAAALAAHRMPEQGRLTGDVARWSEQLAAPVGLALAAVVYAQAIFGVVPLAHDPTSRLLTYGWREVATDIEAARANIGAPVILADDYTLASVIPFYLPSQTPVHQISERVRWSAEPQPSASPFEGPMLYACRSRCWRAPLLESRFRQVQRIATLWRMRNGVRVERVELYRVADPIGPALDPVYPVRVKGIDYDTL
jgi:hypothetical protein